MTDTSNDLAARLARLEEAAAREAADEARKSGPPIRPPNPDYVTRETEKAMAATRSRMTAAQIRAYEGGATALLKAAGFRGETKAATRPAGNADDVLAAWRDTYDGVTAFARTVDQILVRRAELEAAPPRCGTCGHVLEVDPRLDELENEARYLAERLERLGWARSDRPYRSLHADLDRLPALPTATLGPPNPGRYPYREYSVDEFAAIDARRKAAVTPAPLAPR